MMMFKKMGLGLGVLLICGMSAGAQDEMVSRLERKAYDFFAAVQSPSGFVLDRMNDASVISSAGVGYQLASICIGLQREWLTRDAASEQMLNVLHALELLPVQHGFFASYYHSEKYVPLPLNHPSDDGGNTVATAWLMSGMLLAQSVFDAPNDAESEIRGLCSSFFSAVEWDWMFGSNDGTSQYRMAAFWSPSTGYSEERLDAAQNISAMMAYLLSFGSIAHTAPLDSWQLGWRATYQYLLYDQWRMIKCPPLLKQLEVHAWLPLRYLRDGADDYWTSAYLAVEANRTYAQRNLYPEYALWGLSSCESPNGFELYGYPPELGAAEQDKVICLPALVSSYPFLPESVRKALSDTGRRFNDQVFGPYGFYDAVCPEQHWSFKDYTASFLGQVMLHMNQMQPDSMARRLDRHPVIRSAMSKIGMDLLIDDFEAVPMPCIPATWIPSLGYSMQRTDEAPAQGRFSMSGTVNSRFGATSPWVCRPSQHDFSQWDAIKIWSRYAALLDVRMVDGRGRELSLKAASSLEGDQGWRHLYYRIPGDSDFDYTDVTELRIFPLSLDGAGKGVIGLDDIRLTRRIITRPPPQPDGLTVEKTRMPGEVVLRWKPLDKMLHPMAWKYLFKCSKHPLRENRDFSTYQDLPGYDSASVGLQHSEIFVSGLPSDSTWYFGARTQDVDGNMSTTAAGSGMYIGRIDYPDRFELDYFDGNTRNRWITTPSIQVTKTQRVFLQGVSCLEVNYRKTTEADRWAYLGVDLDIRDFSHYRYIRMWVAGETSLMLRLIDHSGKTADTAIERVSNLDGWSPVTFDIGQLSGINMSAIERIQIYVQPDKTNMAGMFYLDALELSKSKN